MRDRTWKKPIFLALSFLFPALFPPAFGASLVTGEMTAAGVSGRPELRPHGWFEELISVSPRGTGTGDADWTGSPTSRGFFDLTVPAGFPAGPYTLFTLKFDGIPAFDFLRDIQVPGGTTTFTRDFPTRADYSVQYDIAFPEWGDEPWTWGLEFYQTFTATSRHVTRTATRLAGRNSGVENLAFRVYRTNPGPPSSWTPVTPVRARPVGHLTQDIIAQFIIWAAFRSEESEIVPGEEYALRVWSPDGNTRNEEFAVMARNDDGSGYGSGHLYNGDTPVPGLDIYGYVSGGGDNNALVNYAPVSDFQTAELMGWDMRHGQTFRASGTGLAAIELVYATGPEPPERPITFQLYESVGGAPVGPAKTCFGAPGPAQSRAAAFWWPDEAPLVPGRTYYVEMNSAGVNVWRMLDGYPFGDYYRNRRRIENRDLLMAIAEYEFSPTEPALMSY